MTLEVKTTPTRNEHSVIFELNKELIPPGTGLSFSSAEMAKSHPLANTLFQIPGVASVWILGSEVQVTKDDRARWTSIHSKVVEAIKKIEGSAN